MNISAVQLEYILALETHRSFMKAAQHCNVTQPALSMQLKKLEDALGILIFDRSKQPLIPTPEGVAVIEQAKSALHELHKIEEIVNLGKGIVEGRLSIGIIPTLAPYLLPLFIGNFIKKYPGVNVRVEELKTDEILDSLNRDLIDVGIMVTPTHRPSFSEIPLFYEEFYAYLNEDLCRQNTSNHVTIEELLNTKLWLLEEGNCFRNQTFNLCGMDQINFREWNFKYESGNLYTLLKMVDHQGGSTLVPQLAAVDFSEERKERLKFIGHGHPVREVSLVYNRKFVKKELISKLREEIKDSLPFELSNNRAENIVEIYRRAQTPSL